MDTAAMTVPAAPHTGADTELTPASRSEDDSAKPCLRTSSRSAAVKRAWTRPACITSVGCHANNTLAADPADIVIVVPTGIESRKPTGRSTAAMQMRWSPWRRYS